MGRDDVVVWPSNHLVQDVIPPPEHGPDRRAVTWQPLPDPRRGPPGLDAPLPTQARRDDGGIAVTGAAGVETDPFRIRGHIADFDSIVADIVARSAATRATLRMEANVAYGSAPSETVDLFFPADAATPCPVHIFIHGGYWRAFSKSDYSLVADTVTAAGAIAVIVDYALMPAVRMVTLVDQVRRAKQWVLENIARYGGDPDQLTISGHSAGAHLATMLFQHERGPSRVRSALLLGGLYDLKPLQKSFLKHEIALTDDEVAAFTPMKKQYDATTDVMVVVGAKETPPFHQQANTFSRKLSSQGLTVSQRIVVNRNHMNSVRDLGVPHSLTGRYLTELIAGAQRSAVSRVASEPA